MTPTTIQAFATELIKVGAVGSTIGMMALTSKKRRNTKADRAKIKAIGGTKTANEMMGYSGGDMQGHGAGIGDWEKLNKLKAGKKKLKKTAEEEAGDTVQDVLSEMLAQSQSQSGEQNDQAPMWADQGATDQENIDDPAYGHGKGLKSQPSKAAVKAPMTAPATAPKVPPKTAPKKAPRKPPPPQPSSPSRMGPKMMAGEGTVAKVAAQFFANMSKLADNRNQFIGSQAEQRRPPRPAPAPRQAPPRTFATPTGAPIIPPSAPKQRGTQDMMRDMDSLDGPSAKPSATKPVPRGQPVGGQPFVASRTPQPR